MATTHESVDTYVNVADEDVNEEGALVKEKVKETDQDASDKDLPATEDHRSDEAAAAVVPNDEPGNGDTSDSDDSMNKKPAAVKDDDDEDSSSSDSRSCSGSDDDDDSDSDNSNPKTGVTNSSDPQNEAPIEDAPNPSQQLDEEGRPLSVYEIQRLERIKRNRELLAQLGLQGKGEGGGVLGKKKNPSGSRPRKSESKNEQVVVQRRQTISRKSKLNRKSYKEPSKSVRSLLRDAEKESASAQKKSPTPKAPRKPRSDRMSKEIYEAFQQISTKKKRVLKQAQRNVRYSSKEVKYWKKRINALGKPVARKREDLREKSVLEGKTGREFVQIVDERMSEIMETLETYEDSMTAGQKEKEREYNKLVANEKLKTMDALDRFPKAMKQTTSLLNSMLLERAPKDPPPPRRSKRSMAPEEQEDSKPASTKKASSKKQKVAREDDGITQHATTYDAKVEPLSEDQPESNAEKVAKGRTKRVARNVGGWVSPEFAALVDRSWLDNSKSNENITLSAYVPQPGETILYYVAGHKKYLEVYPDVLAKKTRTKSRVPLWERVLPTKQKRETKRSAAKNAAEDRKDGCQPESWWSEEWQTGSFDLYPILCRVERTHAEFPPDPWGKVVQKQGDGSDGAKLYFKKPKGPGSRISTGNANIRLAVELRPLLPLAPTPSGKQLDLPPVFTVVTFPCPDLEPFLVPFVWAYARTHALRLNQKVVVAGGVDGFRVRVDAFHSLEDRNSQEHVDKNLRSLVESYCPPGQPLYAKLDEDISSTRYPLRDARLVFDLWRQRVANGAEPKSNDESPESLTFLAMVASTMPMWQGVTTMKDMFDRKKLAYSPWRLFSPPNKRANVDQWSLSTYRASIDTTLVQKLSCYLDDFIANSIEASQLFLEPITEDVAPSYYCAVPVGMCLSKIRERLLVGSSNNCFYRTIEALQSDISSLLECCLQYNSPDSPVVAEATSIVSNLRDSVIRISQDHSREAKKALQVDEERRRLLRELSVPVNTGSSVGTRIPGVFDVRNPTKGDISSDWLEETKRSDQFCSFQAGDKVLYSRELHKQFVEAHYGSLESFQCVLPTPEANGDGDSDISRANHTEWRLGSIRWTRAVFPKSLMKLSADDAYTFPSSTTLQCFGVQFESDKETVTPLYWRPCYASDSSRDGLCSRCSLPFKTSFIRLAEPPETDPRLHADVTPVFRLFKTRCIQNTIPATVDNNLTKAAVQSGYLPSRPKIGELPTFPSLLVLPDRIREMVKVEPSRHRKKTNAKRNGPKESTKVANLIHAGFLPTWAGNSQRLEEVFQIPSTIKPVFPSPRLCLELICMRLEDGYYRQKEALENDLWESYISLAAILLFEGASRKKDPISIKRIAKLLNAKTQADETKPVVAEESLLLEQLRHMRELYVGALVTVSNPSQAQVVFGLTPPLPPKPPETHVVDPDPVRAFAGEKISRLLDVLGRDKCTNIFKCPEGQATMPVFALSVTTGGKLLTFDQDAGVPTKTPFIDHQGREGSLTLALGNKRVAVPPSNGCTVAGGGNRKILSNAPTILFGADEYDGNEMLSRFLFQRPDRMRPCVRCRSYRRSMLVCRVMRKHSNSDYDWSYDFGGGVQYLDRLLNILRGEDTCAAQSVDEFLASLSTAPPSAVRIEQTNQESENDADPRVCLKEAERVLENSARAVEAAQLYSQTPNRLSKECVATTFPIDEDDGHFLFCVVCGLSGDLLCCDGCPNVVHVNCIGLRALPEGDWFCEDCEQSKSASKGGLRGTEDDVCKVSTLKIHKGPFGRTEFDESEVISAAQTIERLQSLRPTQRVRTKPATTGLDDVEVVSGTEDGQGGLAGTEDSEHNDAPSPASTKTTNSTRLASPKAKVKKTRRRRREEVDDDETTELEEGRRRHSRRRVAQSTPARHDSRNGNSPVSSQTKRSPRQRSKTRFFRPPVGTDRESQHKRKGLGSSLRKTGETAKETRSDTNKQEKDGSLRRSTRKARKTRFDS